MGGTAVSRAYRYREIAVLPWGPAARHDPIDPAFIYLFIYLSWSLIRCQAMPGGSNLSGPGDHRCLVFSGNGSGPRNSCRAVWMDGCGPGHGCRPPPTLSLKGPMVLGKATLKQNATPSLTKLF